MVYLGVDNNLDAETYDKLVQLKNGWQDGTDGKIIVYQDTPFKDTPRLMEIDGKSEKGYILSLIHILANTFMSYFFKFGKLQIYNIKRRLSRGGGNMADLGAKFNETWYKIW